MKSFARVLALAGAALAAIGAGSMDAPPRANVHYYEYAPPGSYHPKMVIGRLQLYKAAEGETFLDIGRREDVGIGEMEIANRGVDPWLPALAPGILVPTAYVLPRGAYEGLMINVPEMRMYYFPGPRGRVATFPLGLGPYDWQTPRGVFKVSRKEVDPTWRVPRSIQAEMENPVAVVPPGPDNPLGKYRFVLSIPGYGIHGTNKPWGVGRYYSHGCIRMYPEDIHYLYDRIPRKHPVEIVYQPVKVGLQGDQVFVEVHMDPYSLVPDPVAEAWRQIDDLGARGRVDDRRVRLAVLKRQGIPINVTKGFAAVTVPKVPGLPEAGLRMPEASATGHGGFRVSNRLGVAGKAPGATSSGASRR
ncbi:MAG: L,D-transpeptidase family protein [Myxococcota bacterium]